MWTSSSTPWDACWALVALRGGPLAFDLRVGGWQADTALSGLCLRAMGCDTDGPDLNMVKVFSQARQRQLQLVYCCVYTQPPEPVRPRLPREHNKPMIREQVYWSSLDRPRSLLCVPVTPTVFRCLKFKPLMVEKTASKTCPAHHSASCEV